MSQEEQFHKSRGEYIHIINANKAKDNATADFLPIIAKIFGPIFFFLTDMYCI